MKNLRPLFLMAAAAQILSAQTSLTLTAPAAAVRPGQQVTVTLNLVGSTPAAAGIVYFVNSPAGWTPGAITIGAAGTAASKQIKCSAVTSPRGCAIYNLSNNLIGAGILASIPYTVPATATPGQAQISLSSVTAASANASPVNITAAVLNLNVLSRFDLNGDGSVNDQDMQPVLDQIIGTSSCSTGDFNDDGNCNAIDMLLMIVRGILGL